MEVAIVTGSGGLVGSEAVKFFCGKFDQVVGFDNDMWARLFGARRAIRKPISP